VLAVIPPGEDVDTLVSASTVEAPGALDGLADCAPPCLSLYQPTHRNHPDNQQDPIRFRNLVKQLETSLLQRATATEVAALLAPFHALEADHDFWTHTRDGLAILAAADTFRVFTLQRRVAELAIVADSFHTKPLMRLRQAADRYQVLGLDRQGIRLFEGNSFALDEIAPSPLIPRTLADALADQLNEPDRDAATQGGGGGSPNAKRHGVGGKDAEVDLDADRFFRVIARGVAEHHSKPSGLPLILATLPEHRHRFHALSRNPQLLEDGIDVHPDALSLDELRARAWQVAEPRALARVDALIGEFGAARAHGLGDDALDAVAAAIATGRVATLIVEADRVIPGRVDAATGVITPADMSSPDVDDVLDDLAELAERQGGKVVVVPSSRMPTPTGIAAIYRY
jgi:hypothetical protein